MRFSIRDLLLTMLVIAIAAMLYRSMLYQRELQARVQQTRAEAMALETQLAVEVDLVSQLHAQRVALNEAKSIAATLKEAFPALQNKYGRIEVRNEQTLSIRRFPTLREPNDTHEFVRYRIYVPKERKIYLKFGVETKHLHDPQPPADSSSRWITTSDFYPSGPFELELQRGWHDFDWADGKNAAGRWNRSFDWTASTW